MPRTLVKSNRPTFTDLGGLAAMVGDGDRFGVGGHHFARLPIALLRAITARRLRYVSWAGGLPLEMLLEDDAIASIDICFSSLDVFGLPPRFRAAAEKGAIPVRDWTALAMIQALRARQQNLPMLPFQLPLGSDMMALVPSAATIDDPLSGTAVGAVPPLELDTLVLHAPRADESGNVEIIGAKALDLAMVGAAAKVLVTVESIVARGALSDAGRQTILTRNQITAIAEAPGGAWPASCLPIYVTDYAALRTILDPATPSLKAALQLPAGGVPDFVRAASGIHAADVRPPFPSVVGRGRPEAGVDEIMAARIAAELDDESFASAGAVSPLANVAYRLAKATHAPDMIIATMSCGHLDIRPSPMVLSLIESLDAETAVAHAGGDETYSAYYQAGAVTHEIIAAAQVDGRARVNNIRLARKGGGFVRLPGQGGMADVANMHRDYVLYVTRHSPLALVAEVDVASCGRGLVAGAEREAAGYRPGVTRLFTDLCVFQLDPETGLLVVVEVMPGVSRARIVEATGFPVRFAEDCGEVAVPDAEILRVLREEIDPLGLRRLEFVAARERGALLDEIVSGDRDLVMGLAAAETRDRSPRLKDMVR